MQYDEPSLRSGRGAMPRVGAAGRYLAGLVFLTAVVFAMPPTAAAQDNAQAQLDAFVEQVRSASGSFVQTTQSSQGVTAPPQSGDFAFQRPGRFKWATQKPFEQLIVSDGKQLFQYDPDLAQVTVRAVDAAIGNAPAQVLFGEGSLEASFKVEPLESRDGLAWLRAIPHTADAGFAYMDIGMSGNLPARIEILDAFGQKTRVEFTTILPNPNLPANTFAFAAPPGVDVVRMQ